jgi:hypothetical protein
MRRLVGTSGLLVMVLATSSVVLGQTSDAALCDRVRQLVEKLDASKMEARQAAEDGLINLGPPALPLLPELPRSASAEQKQRLERVRNALRDAADSQANLGASKVTIAGKGLRLSEVLQQLQKQSGNLITDLREPEGAEATNPALDLEVRDKPFFDALDEVARKADVVPNSFTGDGSIGLMAGRLPEKRLVKDTGPFRVTFTQIAVVRDLQTNSASASVQFAVAWEPRLRPMLLQIKTDELKIQDDQGRPVEPQVMNESSEVVLRPDNPAVEVNLTMNAPDRSAKSLATMKVRADITVPAGLRTFRFPTLDIKDAVVQKQGDIAVTLEGTEVDEQVWKVNVVLEYPGEGPAFESYRQGLFNNRLWLQKADGSRFEHNGGFSNTSNDGGKLGFEYLFVDAPGKLADYQLVYETPSKVLTIPLEFEFKDVPLP